MSVVCTVAVADYIVASAAALLGVPRESVASRLTDEMLTAFMFEPSTQILVVNITYEDNAEVVAVSLDKYNLSGVKNLVLFMKKKPTLFEDVDDIPACKTREIEQSAVLDFINVASSGTSTVIDFFKGTLDKVLLPCSEAIAQSIGTSTSKNCFVTLKNITSSMEGPLAQLSSEFKITIPKLAAPKEIQEAVNKAIKEDRMAEVKDIPGHESLMQTEDSTEYSNLVDKIKEGLYVYRQQLATLVNYDLEASSVVNAYQILSFYDEKLSAIKTVQADIDAQKKIQLYDLLLKEKNNAVLLIDKKSVDYAITQLYSIGTELENMQISNLKSKLDELKKVSTIADLTLFVDELNKSFRAISSRAAQKTFSATKADGHQKSQTIQFDTLLKLCHDDIFFCLIKILSADGFALLAHPFKVFASEIQDASDFLNTTMSRVDQLTGFNSGSFSTASDDNTVVLSIIRTYRSFYEFLQKMKELKKKLSDFEESFGLIYSRDSPRFIYLENTVKVANTEIRNAIRDINKDTSLTAAWNTIQNKVQPMINEIEESISGDIRKDLEKAETLEAKYDVFKKFRPFLTNPTLQDIIKPHQQIIMEHLSNRLTSIFTEANTSFEKNPYGIALNTISDETSAHAKRLYYSLSLENKIAEIINILRIVFGNNWSEEKQLEPIRTKINQISSVRAPNKVVDAILGKWRDMTMKYIQSGTGIFKIKIRPLKVLPTNQRLSICEVPFNQFKTDHILLNDVLKTKYWAHLNDLKSDNKDLEKRINMFMNEFKSLKNVFNLINLNFNDHINPILFAIRNSLNIYYFTLNELEKWNNQLPMYDFTKVEFLETIKPPFMQCSLESSQMLFEPQKDIMKAIKDLYNHQFYVVIDARNKENLSSKEDEKISQEFKEDSRKYIEERKKFGDKSNVLIEKVKRFYQATLSMGNSCKRLDKLLEELVMCPRNEINSKMKLINNVITDGFGLTEVTWGDQIRGKEDYKTPYYFFLKRLYVIMAGILRSRMLNDLEEYIDGFDESEEEEEEQKPIEEEEHWLPKESWIKMWLGKQEPQKPKEYEIMLKYDQDTGNIVSRPSFQSVKLDMFMRYNEIVSIYTDIPALNYDNNFNVSEIHIPRTFKALAYSIPKRFLLTLNKKVHATLSVAVKFGSSWNEYKKLWALKPSFVANKLEMDLAKWQAVLMNLQNDKKTLFNRPVVDLESGNKNKFHKGPVTVNSASVQDEIKNEFYIWVKDFIEYFYKMFGQTINDLYEKIDENVLSLQKLKTPTFNKEDNSQGSETQTFLLTVSGIQQFFEQNYSSVENLFTIGQIIKDTGMTIKQPANQNRKTIESLVSKFNDLYSVLSGKIEYMKNSIDALYDIVRVMDTQIQDKTNHQAKKWSVFKTKNLDRNNKSEHQKSLANVFSSHLEVFNQLLIDINNLSQVKGCLDVIVSSMNSQNTLLRPITSEKSTEKRAVTQKVSKLDLVTIRERTADKINDIIEDISVLNELLTKIGHIEGKLQRTMNIPLMECDIEKLHLSLEEMDKELSDMSAKSSSFQVYQELKDNIWNKKELEKFIRLMRNKIFKITYWRTYASDLYKYLVQTKQIGKYNEQVNLLKNFVVDIDNSDYTLGNAFELLEKPGSIPVKILTQVFENARGEASLKNILKGIEAFVNNYELTIIEALAARGQCKLITGWDDLTTKLDDNISTLQSMHNSPYYANSVGANSIKVNVEKFEAVIQSLIDLFTIWADVQRKWIHLQGVFVIFNSNQTLANQLSDEISTMNLTNKEFIQIMKEVEENNTLRYIIDNMNHYDTVNSQYVLASALTEILNRLNRIQKSLGKFLESQRNSFPRLYFVGDDDLLEVISITNKNDILRINRHMRKMFAGIGEILVETVDNEVKLVTGIRSIHGEVIYFPFKIPIEVFSQKGSGSDSLDIHMLLESLETLVFNRMRLITIDNINELRNIIELPSYKQTVEYIKMGGGNSQLQSYFNEFKQIILEWLVSLPIQCSLLSLNILWTQLIEDSITSKNGATIDSVLTLVDCLLEILSGSDAQDLLVLKYGDEYNSSDNAREIEKRYPNLHMFPSYKSLIVSDLIHMRESTRYLDSLKRETANNQLTEYMFEKSATLRYYQESSNPFFYEKLEKIVNLIEKQYETACSDNLSEIKNLLKNELMIGHITVKMGEANIPYGYEYVGSENRIVQTPLTDKCYYTLMQALHYKLGGSPFGPAGTGKTESVKALGILLGRFVLVFNCDENFDDSAMGRIFVGLCQVGAFCCLDEFNRLTEASLSAVSQQILSIQTSLKDGKKAKLLDQEVAINPNVGIFITTNPTYAGRNQLPDNLKGLFRSVAMIEPDKQLIAQVMLFSQGFREAEKLSKQIVPLFRLCGEQLSNQPHYDWGLRALKAVLIAAGKQKRTIIEKIKSAHRNDAETLNKMLADINTHTKEQQIIVQSLQTSILPKLVSFDTPLFNSLLQDLYPGIDISLTIDDTLRYAIYTMILKNNFVPYDEWITKIVQLFLTTNTKTTSGTMLVGPSGSGKTASFLTLVGALRYYQHKPVYYYTIDPKSISKDELYGSLDAMTREWKDGIFTSILRKVIENNANMMEAGKKDDMESLPQYYIIFDGAVDPIWVENLNSVLDDNKTLTLPSGERLNLPSNCHLIFEVLDLANATLATVSRCNMIYYGETTVKHEHYILKELRNLRRIDICSMQNYGADGTVSGIPAGCGTNNLYNERFMLDINDADYNAFIEGKVIPVNDNILNNPNKTKHDQIIKYQNLAMDVLEPFFSPLYSSITENNNKTSLINPYVLYDSPYAYIYEAVNESCRKYDIMKFTESRVIGSMKVLLLSSIRDYYRYFDESNQMNMLTDKGAIQDFITKRLLLAVTWGFVSSLNNDGRQEVGQRISELIQSFANKKIELMAFMNEIANGKHKEYTDQHVRLLYLSQLVDMSQFEETMKHLNSILPAQGLIDVYVGTDKYNSGEFPWVSWYEVVQGSFGNDASSITENDVGLKVISTIDTARHGYLISSWLTMHAPLILCGPAGSGKSMSLEATLRSMADYMHAGVNFSSCTSPDIIRQYFSRYCKKTTTANGPVMTIGTTNAAIRNLVLFCDEINLPAEDAFGTQRVIAFIRSIVELGGYWDPNDNQFVRLDNIHFSGACNPPTDPGRQELTPRFLRHAPVLLVDYPTEESLYMIYNCFNKAVLSKVSQCRELSTETSKAMIDTYIQTKKRLTPNKQPHYIYSPRELTRWTRALKTCFDSISDLETVTPEELMKIIFHEGMRLFHDRIVTEADKAWTRDLIYNSIRMAFKDYRIEDAIGPVNTSASIMYSQWLSGDRYEQVDRQDLRRFIEKRLKDFRNEVLNIDIVIFDEILEHLTRIERVLRQPIGHVLLAGDSGSGKTFLARFAAFINSYEYIEINTYKGYTLEDFENELRHCMKLAGIQGKSVVFVFDESNALDTSFTEHMNALLAAGDVVGLFEDDEANKLYGEIRDKIPSLPPSKHQITSQSSNDELYEWFKGRVRNNLHVVFTMNPPRSLRQVEDEDEGNGDEKNEMLEKAATSPALFNRCVVDWIGNWSLSHVFQIATHKFKMIDLVDFGQNTVSVMEMEQCIECDNKVITILSDPGSPLDSQINSLKEFISDMPLKYRAARACALIHLRAQQEADEMAKFYSGKTGAGILSGSSQCLATPRHFMSFLRVMITMWKRKEESRMKLAEHTIKGLKVLAETEQHVNTLKVDLAEKGKVLKEASENADKKLQEMIAEKSEAEKRKKEAEEIKMEVEEKRKEIDVQKSSALSQLNEVEPLVESALQSVKSINKRDLDELRSLAHPPEGVRLTLEAVLIILGSIKPGTGWEDIRKIIKGANFIPSIINFKTREQLTPKIIKQVKSYITNPNFTEEVVLKASKAAGPMVNWVKSQMKYAEIVSQVEPLRRMVASLEDEANAKAAYADKLVSEINNLEEKIKQYEIDYKQLIQKAESLKIEMSSVEVKVNRALKLMDSLSGEKMRWEKQRDEWEHDAATFAGDMIISSAFTAYCGAYPQDTRISLINQWKEILEETKIAYGDDLIIHEFLSNADERDIWLSNGLPNDDISIANAAILMNSDDVEDELILSNKQDSRKFPKKETTPLLIDPSGQAIAWLQKQYGDRLNRTSFLSNTFTRTLEQAVRLGQTLLVEDVEHLDPIINPLLDIESLHNSTSGRTVVKLGTKEIDYSPGFMMILTTRDRSVQFPPSLSSRCTILNYTVTQASLCSQCLNMILQYECPEVGSKRQQLLQEEREFVIKLRNLEKQLLEILNRSGGNILDNEEIAKTLETVKQEANEVEIKRAAAVSVREELDKASNRYQYFSHAASAIYFLIRRLNTAHYSLSFTLSFFMDILISTINAFALSPKADRSSESMTDSVTIQRMCKVINELVFKVYALIGCAMPTSLRLPFAIAIITTLRSVIKEICLNSQYGNLYNNFLMIMEDQEIDSYVDEYLINGTIMGTGLDSANSGRDSSYTEELSGVINRTQFSQLKAILEILPSSKTLLDAINDRDTARHIFKDQFKSMDNIKNVLRCSSTDSLSSLRASTVCLIISRVIFPQYFEECATQFVTDFFEHTAGMKTFLSQPEDVTLQLVSDKFGMNYPLLLLSSGGFDMTQKVVNMANISGTQIINIPVGSLDCTKQNISKMINDCARKGSWLLISNLHLATGDFITDLLVLCKDKLDANKPDTGRSVSSRNINPKFRIFLTSNLVPTLPSSLFQNTVRLIEEAPPGLLTQINRALVLLEPNQGTTTAITMSDNTTYKARLVNRVYFLICVLHGILSQRAKYVPIGWLKDHEINRSDFLSAISVAHSWLEKGLNTDIPDKEKVPFEAIREILEITCYGGKIHASSDRRILHSFINHILSVDALDDGFNVTIQCKQDEDIVFKLPSIEATYQDYKDYINSLDQIEPPEFIGLTSAAKAIRLGLEGRTSIGVYNTIAVEEKSRMEIDTETSAQTTEQHIHLIDDWLARLADLEETGEQLDTNSDDPIIRCIARERVSLKKLVSMFETDLMLLRKTLTNEMLPTNRTTGLLQAIVINAIPAAWSSETPYIIPLGLSCTDYIRDACNRFNHVSKLVSGARNDIFHQDIWLGGLCHPRAFLTALRQKTSRMTKAPLEDLVVNVALNTNVRNNPEYSINVINSRIVCCALDGSKIVPSEVSEQCIEKLCLSYSTKDAAYAQPVPIPIFIDSSRNDSIFEATVEGDAAVPQSYWCTRGVGITLWNSE